MSKYAYCTVLTNESYTDGVLSLWNSIIKTKSIYPLVVLISNKISKEIINKLSGIMHTYVFDEDINLDKRVLKDNSGFFEKWNTTFYKLKVLNLCEYEKIVMLDADMIVMKNLDHLFDRPHMSCSFAVTSKKVYIGLNSGLMVLKPSKDLYDKMVSSILPAKEAYGGKPIGDQDVYRYVYSDWNSHHELHLPMTYNCYNSEIDAFVKNKELLFKDIYVIHFILTKPWTIKNSVLLKQKILRIFGIYKDKYILKSNIIWKKQYCKAIKKINNNYKIR